MNKIEIMKELIERYQQLEYAGPNKYIVEERIKKLENKLSEVMVYSIGNVCFTEYKEQLGNLLDIHGVSEGDEVEVNTVSYSETLEGVQSVYINGKYGFSISVIASEIWDILKKEDPERTCCVDLLMCSDNSVEGCEFNG